MRRKVYDLLKKKKFIILLEGERSKKLKDDFVSFFSIKNYQAVDIEKFVCVGGGTNL